MRNNMNAKLLTIFWLAIISVGALNKNRGSHAVLPCLTTGLEYHGVDCECNKYIKCTIGLPKIQSCQSGLHWNNQMQFCDNPIDSGCVPCSAEGRCVGIVGPEFIGFDEENCNKFILCTNGKEHHMSCPKGLHWNKRTKYCDSPEKAECLRKPKPPTKIKGCEDVEEAEVKPIKNDCNSFLNCAKKQGYRLNCPVNTYFSEDHCISNNDDCLKSKCTEKDEIITECSKYVKCTDEGEGSVDECPEGEHFDKKADACEEDGPGDCIIDSSEYLGVCKADNIGFVQHPTDCHKFAQCWKGKEYSLQCPEGLAWNGKLCVELDSCKPKSKLKVKCEEDKFLPHPHECTKFVACVDKIPHEMMCPIGLVWKDKACTLYDKTNCEITDDISEIKGVCDEKRNGFVEHPMDKTKFIQCFKNLPYIMQCPSKFIWKQNSKICKMN